MEKECFDKFSSAAADRLDGQCFVLQLSVV